MTVCVRCNNRERERERELKIEIVKECILTRQNTSNHQLSYNELVYIPTKLGQVPFLLFTKLARYVHGLV